LNKGSKTIIPSKKTESCKRKRKGQLWKKNGARRYEWAVVTAELPTSIQKIRKLE